MMSDRRACLVSELVAAQFKGAGSIRGAASELVVEGFLGEWMEPWIVGVFRSIIGCYTHMNDCGMLGLRQ